MRRRFLREIKSRALLSTESQGTRSMALAVLRDAEALLKAHRARAESSTETHCGL